MSLPETVALTLCPAETEAGRMIQVSGLFDIVEHWGYEPSAGVRSPGFLVSPIADRESIEPNRPPLWIDEAVLIEQVCPDAHASALLHEREMDYCSEMMELGERKPYFDCPMNVPGEMDRDDEDKGHTFAPTGNEQVHLDRFAGVMHAVEERCTLCGMTRWDY